MKLKNRVQGSKFEYFLNAVFYCMWRFDMRFSELSEVIFFGFMNVVCSIFLPKRFLQKLKDRQIAAKQQLETICYDVDYGINIRIIAKLLHSLSVGYASILTSIIIGIGWNKDINMPDAYVLLIIFVTCMPALKVVDWTVTDDNRYLRFFREFNKESKVWHHKWNLITLTFCIGSVLTLFLGFACIWIIIICF